MSRPTALPPDNFQGRSALNHHQFFAPNSEQGDTEALLKTVYNSIPDISDTMFLDVGESSKHRMLTNYLASADADKEKKKKKTSYF